MNLQKIVAKLNTQPDSISLPNKQPKEVKFSSPIITALESRLATSSTRFNKAIRALRNEMETVSPTDQGKIPAYETDKQRYS